jgi:hypothetical protein
MVRIMANTTQAISKIGGINSYITDLLDDKANLGMEKVFDATTLQKPNESRLLVIKEAYTAALIFFGGRNILRDFALRSMQLVQENEKKYQEGSITAEEFLKLKNFLTSEINNIKVVYQLIKEHAVDTPRKPAFTTWSSSLTRTFPFDEKMLELIVDAYMEGKFMPLDGSGKKDAREVGGSLKFIDNPTQQKTLKVKQ